MKAFFRARPAAVRIGPWASSFASSWTRVTRYPDYGNVLAKSSPANRIGVVKPGVRTKFASAAALSCCSAPFLVGPSMKS